VVNRPKRKNFESSNCDYDFILCSLENPERLVKILHVKSSVKVGDILELDADLEILLRSEFFDFWTDPHIHIEVRNLRVF